MIYTTLFCIQNYDFGDYFIVSEYNEFIDNLKIGDNINFEGIIKPLGESNINNWTNIGIYGTICGFEKTIKNDPKEKSIKLILVILWMLLIFSFSNQKAEDSSKLSDGIIVKVANVFVDKELSIERQEEILETYDCLSY